MPLALAPGVVVAARFRLTRRLGEGGMGVVWAAEELASGREVALKLLKDGTLSSDHRRRFQREARAASAVRHRNVVAASEVLSLDDGGLALVMELLDGEPMSARLSRQGRMSPAEAAAIGREVAEAIAAAHEAGVVHRDLKPDNVFLARDGGVRVLDFGVAKLLPGDGLAAGSLLTWTGSVIGTPHFMSPEQAFGERTVDERTDVWSLGVLLHHAVTGTLPTAADNVGQILKIIVTGAIPKLAQAAPGAPPALCDLVDRMLSRERELRPGLDEVLDVLSRVAGSAPPGPPLDSTLADGTAPTPPLATPLVGATPDEGAPPEGFAGALGTTAVEVDPPESRFERLAVPETRYAESAGGVSIAYQVFGEGPVRLVLSPGIVSHIEAHWERPEGVRFLSLLGSFARVLVFDKRGTGMSDRLPDDRPPSIEERMADVLAVMDAESIDSAVLMGISEGGPTMASFAASHPERTRALVLYGTAARFKPSPELSAFVEMVRATWGKGAVSQLFAPESKADPELGRWFARIERLSATPRAATALAEMLSTIDVRDVLPDIRVPTLVLHRAGDRLVSRGAARALASRIAGATMLEYESGPHHPMVGDNLGLLRDIRAFVRPFAR